MMYVIKYSVIRMTRRPTPTSRPERPILTVGQKRQCIDRLQRRIKELEDFDPQTVQKRFSVPEVMALEASVDEALSAAFGHGTIEYDRYSRATCLDHGPIIANMSDEWIEVRGGSGGHHNERLEARLYLTEGKQQSLSLLRQAVRGLEEEIELAEPVHGSSLSEVASPKPSQKIFVVHGHDEAALQAVARFLEQLELEAIVLSEQPDQGRTIIEKFEDYAGEVGFAVVILTPDDLVGTESSQASRARQNVIFELGYLVGKLGRGRACLLRKGEVEIPSDLYGVIYTDMDEGEGWKLKLVKELKAAKLEFDANKVWG